MTLFALKLKILCCCELANCMDCTKKKTPLCILNIPQKAETSPAAPYLPPSPEPNPAASSTSAVRPSLSLTNVRLEEPGVAPYNSFQSQAGPLRTPGTEAPNIMLRDPEPPSLPLHIDPAKVPPHGPFSLRHVKSSHAMIICFAPPRPPLMPSSCFLCACARLTKKTLPDNLTSSFLGLHGLS